MDRRTFLKHGVAASAAVGGLSQRAEAASAWAADDSVPRRLAAGMIWSRESVPVPVLVDTPKSDIANVTSHAGADLHALFSKELTLPAKPTLATLHLFTYTRYRLSINGSYLGRGPSRFQNQRPEYDSRDVAAALHAGLNRIEVLVHRDAPTGRIMNHEPGFTALLEWVDEAGVTQRIATDTSWSARPELSFGPRDIAWASIEEHIDARRQTGGAGEAAVLVGGPSYFPLFPRTTPLQTETLRAWTTATTLPANLSTSGEISFDLPEIVQGYHVLHFEADEGTTFEVRYDLPEGQHSGLCTYIAQAGAQTYIGGDTFALKRLSVRVTAGRVRLTGAQVFEVRYPFERVGAFHSSDPYLNQLWTICARSLEVLSEDAYVDCADRERVEWTDETPPSFGLTRVMMAGPPLQPGGAKQWSDARLVKALLRRIALTQLPDGQIKSHSCSERFDIHAIMEDRSCDWVIVLREYVESTGDKALIRELWPELVRLMQWFLDHRTARGLVLARDWEVWDNPLRYQICEAAGLNAFVYHALVDAAWLGSAIGEGSRSALYTQAAGALATAFNALLWDEQQGAYYGALFGPGSKMQTQLDRPMFTGPIVDGHYRPTLQAALFALDSGIVPADRLGRLQQWMLTHEGEATGVMSCHFLFKALYAVDDEQQDTSVLDLMRTLWKRQVDSPWQTSWETLADEAGSKVHIYGMVPGYFLSAYVLGVRVEGPVARRSILIEPRHGDLSAAEGVVVTEFGPVPIAWTRSANGAVSLHVTVPENTRATVRLRPTKASQTIEVDGHPKPAVREGAYLRIEFGPGSHSATTL